jgi:hypothetical protein
LTFLCSGTTHQAVPISSSINSLLSTHNGLASELMLLEEGMKHFDLQSAPDFLRVNLNDVGS